jgi:hypothetical protein
MLSCQVAEQFLAVKRIMKRKFEQWWSTILPISTKQNNHLSSQATEHKNTMIYCILNPYSGLGQA